MTDLAVKPLSVIQQTMWLEHRLAPRSAAYNLVLPLRIRARLDVAALSRAVELVAERHELLRTRFLEVEGRPCRVPDDRPLARLELLPQPAGGVAEAAREYVRRPFDLSTGAFRVGLLPVSGTEAVILPVAHHIAGDFMSHWLIVRDLLNAYRDGALPEPSGHYDVFVAEEARIVASPIGERSRAYWSARADGAAAAELPADRPRPALSRRVGASRRARLDPDVAAGLPQAARDAGVTPFALLLGAFTALVRRYTAQDEFLVGVPATNRLGVQMREVAGAFVNPLPIRARFRAGATFRDAAADAGEQLRTGMFHVRYPCGLLGGGAPMFRLAMLMVAADQREPSVPYPAPGEETGPEIEYAGLPVALMDVPSQEGQMDLVIRVEQNSAGIDMVFAYDSDLYDESTIDRFIGQFQRFARAAVTDVDTEVDQTPLTGDDELAALLALGGVWGE
ncbi:condensation domain-containing protein [Actinoplanes utahensis]|uniref:condensation domain-containing protein n=1 Tax=Actinoplanes utahensis TaxID=1869 RepID=UPI00126A28A1|nr:condensation domain-containing protein [Actinoplanes utahensis]